MNSDTLIKNEGMKILSEQLGIVKAERFISLILRESFDYTKWQENLYTDVPLNEFLNNANEFRIKNSQEKKDKPV